MNWRTPTPRVRELIRLGAQTALSTNLGRLDEMENALIAANLGLADDPELTAAAGRSTRANLVHWLSANVQAPGEPVAGNSGSDTLTIARDVVRRGLDQQMMDAYRLGQIVAWRLWISIAFTLTDERSELEELLDVTAASISDFVEATVAEIRTHIQHERDELTSGSHADRREVVALIIEGAPISHERAESRLGYRLSGTHTAAIVWSELADADGGLLDRVVEDLGRAAGARPLGIVASTATRWVWIPGEIGIAAEPDILDLYPGVRVAVGPAANGLAGFRRSHLDALTAQRMMGRLRSGQRLARFSEVELVSLITQDIDGAVAFVRRNLGNLADAPSELRAAVLTFLTEQRNVSRAAEKLFLHRNTLMRRLLRADELLPEPVETNGINIAAALLALLWMREGASVRDDDSSAQALSGRRER